MKRIFALLIALMLTGVFAFAEEINAAPADEGIEASIAEETELVHTISGLVTEVNDEGLLVEDAQIGAVLIKSDAETVLQADAEIVAGDYIHVIYDGMMTRSIPPQVTADLIEMYTITGKIISADPEVNGVLLETETHGEVYAYLPEPWLENTAETLKVYFNGAMTMSIPPQISGDYVVSLSQE